jgi:predicted phosphodiesterase
MSDNKYAILGDVHSNLEALDAVLADAGQQGVTAFVCVGDIVGYNADPLACLDKIRSLAVVSVQGNHDYYCANHDDLDEFHPLAARVIDWTRRQLSDEHARFLRELKIQRSTVDFSIVHSTMDMPEKWGYVFDCLDAEAHFNYQTQALCFYGHTHLPMVFEKQRSVTRGLYSRLELAVGKKYFVNVGSVGQPRDGDPRAAYVVFDARTRTVELRRVEYDICTTQEKILRAGLPDRLSARLQSGR